MKEVGMWGKKGERGERERGCSRGRMRQAGKVRRRRKREGEEGEKERERERRVRNRTRMQMGDEDGAGILAWEWLQVPREDKRQAFLLAAPD